MLQVGGGEENVTCQEGILFRGLGVAAGIVPAGNSNPGDAAALEARGGHLLLLAWLGLCCSLLASF